MAVYKDPKPTKDGRQWYFKISYKDVNGNLPLVLSEFGLPGARYVSGMQWNPYTFRIPHYISDIPLEAG